MSMITEQVERLRTLADIVKDIADNSTDTVKTLREAADTIEQLAAKVREENNDGWIPMTTRPMTEEEREHYREWSEVEGTMIFDCELPEDGQEVLVSYGGYVCVDTFCTDDGCYFEGVDIDDVEAWMPLPEPYREEDKTE